jgi:hypothetical protein
MDLIGKVFMHHPERSGGLTAAGIGIGRHCAAKC